MTGIIGPSLAHLLIAYQRDHNDRRLINLVRAQHDLEIEIAARARERLRRYVREVTIDDVLASDGGAS
jgi:hypothetical protein